MPILLRYIEGVEELSKDLKAVNFLSTMTGELVATMIYERPLTDEWLHFAQIMVDSLKELCSSVTKLNVMGRSSGTKYVVGSDSVTEILDLSDGRRLSYTQVEDGFSNPNGHVNAKALDWICSCIAQAASLIGRGQTSSSDGEAQAIDMDVLELFCGNGNHTVAIAGTV